MMARSKINDCSGIITAENTPCYLYKTNAPNKSFYFSKNNNSGIGISKMLRNVLKDEIVLNLIKDILIIVFYALNTALNCYIPIKHYLHILKPVILLIFQLKHLK